MNPQFNPQCLRAPTALREFLTKTIIRCAVVCILLTGGAAILKANVPGAIVSGSSPAVTLTDHGSTVTMANGIVSIVCTKSGATINQIYYTYNNGAGSTTTQMLNGGTDGGMLYWEYGGFGGSASTYSIVVNPTTGDNNHPAGTYAEIDLLSTSSTNGTVDIHFSMLQGSPGFYVTAIWSHRAQDAAMGLSETRSNIYAGGIFNWMSVDPGRNKLMEVSPSATSIPVPGAPKECYLWTNGIYQGRYDDKYKYSADFGDQQYISTPEPQRVWGWSSVGSSGSNVGLWDVNASSEYYNCGPMKRELMSHIGTTILNMFNGDHYAEGMDAGFASGEVWTKVYGPYFVYCNNVPNASVTDPYQASQTLYNDAVAQSYAEASGTPNATGIAVGATAWPYAWFVNNNYAAPSNRGTVTGQIVVSDSGNPNASGSNMFVGVVQQPLTSANAYDFQFWTKPYYFFVRADANGNFTIPNVIAGSNYTLYAFGPGAESEFMSQLQTGGNPPILYNLPATQFAVPVVGGSTTNLGTITWTPTRVGATVFEIGYPDRTARKFRHGDDYWVGDIGPSPTAPAPVWTKFLEYPFDFPNGLTYNVGTSRWSTDWNYCQPVTTSTSGIYYSSASTITFNLASAPAPGSLASLYLGLASNFGDAALVTVNNTNLGGLSGVTSTPNTFPGSGYTSPYSQSDTTIREGSNGLFADNRVTFSGTMLQVGTNTITISFRQTGNSSGLGYFANHLMYDYVRLELTGYVPPAPASVTTYAGNNSALVAWPVTPGATSYNIYSTTISGSNYSTVATGVVGPVCGSGYENATYLDTTASNGNTYFYVVQAVNTTGSSANSPESPGVTPSSSAPSGPPDPPAGLTPTTGDRQVTLNWNASPNADYYIVQRSVLYNNGGTILSGSVTAAETYNNLGTITLTDTDTGTTYTDTTPTDGSTYSYTVTAVNASGTGSATTAVTAVPQASAPTVAPVLTAAPSTGQVILTWTPVPGAAGYIISGGTSASGPFTIVASITELTYTITGLSTNSTNYYEVEAVNSGGSSAESNLVPATTPPNPPVITSGTSATAAEGAAFRFPVVATNNPTSYTANGLPGGLAINGTSGLISGTATESGTFATALDAINLGGTGTGLLTIVVTPETLPVVSSTLSATGTVGFEFSYQIAANNGPIGYGAAPLPDGVTVNQSTGLISGTPTGTGTFGTLISAVNYGGTTTETLSLAVVTEPIPVISSSLSETCTNSYAFSYQIQASNNPTSFSALNLPPGLSIDDSTGLISGTPNQTGTFGPTINAINLGGTGTETLAIDVLPPPPAVINSILTASGTNGSPFSYQIQGNSNPTSFGATGLPLGLSVDPSTGLISGTLGAGGTFDITLSASNPGGTGTATLVLTVTSSLAGMKGNYEGLASVAGTNEGLFTTTITSSTTGAFTAKLSIAGANYGLKGKLDPTSGTFDSVAAQGHNTLNIALSIDDAVPGVNGSITVTTNFGTITTYDVVSTLLGTFKASTLPTELQGNRYYTVILPSVSDTDPSLPAGNGYGTMNVSKTGAVTISGKLGDGTAIVAKAPLHADGKTWTLFVSSKTLSLAGTLTAEDLPGSDADGTLDWLRFALARNVYYSGGFTVPVDILAAKYTAPVLTTSTGTLIISGGNLPDGITDNLSITIKDKVTVTGTTTGTTTLTIGAKSGSFSGKFPYPPKNKGKAYGGVIYIKPAPAGYGLFTGTNQTGSVEIMP